VRKLLLLLQLLSPPWLKKLLLRWCWRARVGRGVRVGWFSVLSGRRIELGDYCHVHSFTQVRCGEVRLGDYAVVGNGVHVYGPGRFRLGRHSIVGSECQINVWEDVAIGDMSALGSRCIIVTHGVWLPYTEGYWVKFAGVAIGDRVWIASGVFIQPGIRIGNEVFVNAMSVVKKDLPDGTVAEGYPARPVARMADLRRTMTPRRLNAAAETMLRHFGEVVLAREWGINVDASAPGRLRFRRKGRRYLAGYVPAEGEPPAADEWQGADRAVLLVCREGWQPPAGARAPALINVVTMRTSPPRDPVHNALVQFLRGYYGLKLEYED